ncbi:hypothetical protein Tco_0437950 [Tanacetum coccineum]
MADVNAPIEQAPALAPPTRTDEQILPRIRWVPIGKSNCYMDAKKSQSNPIYKITVDILKHTNFFRAFTASSTIPAIYIQQFWDTVCYDRTDGGYKCQLDEEWFNLTKDTLRDALQITPVNNNKAFSSPLTHETLITLSSVRVPYGKDFWLKARAPVLRFFGGITIELITISERMLEEFTQSILTFLEYKKNLAQHTQEREAHSQFAKGTKREVFGMPIPNELITDDIRGADYYDAYLKKVANHQIYLAGEKVSDPDSPTPKPAKSTKPKITKQAKPAAPKAATKKPQPAPTKPNEKKRKQAKETTELVDEFVDEGIPLTKPGFGNLEANTQRAIEESLKDAHGAHRGPLPPVVFKETDTGKFQPLLEVEGKGKDKFGAEQAARVLLNLQTPKKKNPTEQYIFQRHTSAPTEPSGHDESSFLYAKLGLTESDMESDEEVPLVVKSGAPDEGQTRPNPGIQDEGQTGPNPGYDTMSQTLSTPGVHAGPNLEHTDAEATDATRELEQHIVDLVDANQALEERLDKHGSRLYRLENQDIPNQVSKAVDEIVTDAVDWAMHAPLRERFRDLPEADMKEILHNRMWESKSYQTHEDHMTLYEALEKSMARDNRDQLLSDLAEARKKKKKRQGSPKTPSGSPPHPPPPPPPPAGPSGTSGASGASGSSQSPPPPPPPSNTLIRDDKVIKIKYIKMIIDTNQAIPNQEITPVITREANRNEGMRFELREKFSDGTLHQINEALDYRVKEFKVNRRNPCIHSEDGNPARANIKQALGLHKDGDADALFQPTTQLPNSDKYYHDPEECKYAGLKVTTSHEGNIPQQG